jgi:hypothetical protein
MNWEVKKTVGDRLPTTLQSMPPEWKVFAIVPYGTSGEYLVIFKKGD